MRPVHQTMFGSSSTPTSTHARELLLRWRNAVRAAMRGLSEQPTPGFAAAVEEMRKVFGEIEELRRLVANAPRVYGRVLADAFIQQIASERAIVEVWYADENGDPVVTVLTETFDDELEARLHDVFERLVETQSAGGAGLLSIHALDEPHPAPAGIRLYSAPTAHAATSRA